MCCRVRPWSCRVRPRSPCGTPAPSPATWSCPAVPRAPRSGRRRTSRPSSPAGALGTAASGGEDDRPQRRRRRVLRRWRLGDDEALLDVVTSANVACGFHAGDPARWSRRAAPRGPAASQSAPRWAIATWPASAGGSSTSPPRTSTPTCSTSWRPSTASPAPAAGAVTYVKPHGALYNARRDARGAGSRRRRRGPRPGPRRSPSSAYPGPRCSPPHQRPACARSPRASRTGYTPDGTLIVRRDPGALVPTWPSVAAPGGPDGRRGGVVETVDGTLVPVSVESVCVLATPRARWRSPAPSTALTDAGLGLGPSRLTRDPPAGGRRPQRAYDLSRTTTTLAPEPVGQLIHGFRDGRRGPSVTGDDEE